MDEIIKMNELKKQKQKEEEDWNKQCNYFLFVFIITPNAYFYSHIIIAYILVGVY